MSLPKSMCVLSVAPRVCMAKVPFLAIFCARHEHRNGCDHTRELKTYQIILIPNIYIYRFIGLTPLVKVLVLIYHF